MLNSKLPKSSTRIPKVIKRPKELYIWGYRNKIELIRFDFPYQLLVIESDTLTLTTFIKTPEDGSDNLAIII